MCRLYDNCWPHVDARRFARSGDTQRGRERRSVSTFERKVFILRLGAFAFVWLRRSSPCRIVSSSAALPIFYSRRSIVVFDIA